METIKKGDYVVLKSTMSVKWSFKINKYLFSIGKVVEDNEDRVGVVARIYREHCYINWLHGGQSKEKSADLVKVIIKY